MSYPGYKEGGIVVCEGPTETHAEWYVRMVPMRNYTYHHFVIFKGQPILQRRWKIDAEGNYVVLPHSNSR